MDDFEKKRKLKVHDYRDEDETVKHTKGKAAKVTKSGDFMPPEKRKMQLGKRSGGEQIEGEKGLLVKIRPIKGNGSEGE